MLQRGAEPGHGVHNTPGAAMLWSAGGPSQRRDALAFDITWPIWSGVSGPGDSRLAGAFPSAAGRGCGRTPPLVRVGVCLLGEPDALLESEPVAIG
jgi:hypothetical protein